MVFILVKNASQKTEPYVVVMGGVWTALTQALSQGHHHKYLMRIFKMTDIEKWIKAAEISKNFNREVFFGVAVQAMTDEDDYFVVVYQKQTGVTIGGGIKANENDFQKLEELGVLVER